MNISIQLSQPGAQAVGTGIVLDPSGVVLTNNHVISGATSISVNDVGDGKTYPATVVGYDRAHDIAVIQLQGASGLKTATIGDSSKVAAGDPVAAIGNAGGRGGTPAIVAGKVTALNQTVTVLDEITGGAARLTGLIQVMAGIQPGDSGGPLANAAGEVIGVITAGTQSARGSSCATGLAIPINDAITISKQIRAGTASATVHIGPTGVLGVLVRESSPVPPGRRELPHGPRHADVPGAIIASVVPGSPSEHAGLMAGDVITSLDGMGVDSPDALVTLLIAHHPGDSVQVAWVDPAGQQHAAAVVLAEGPPS